MKLGKKIRDILPRLVITILMYILPVSVLLPGQVDGKFQRLTVEKGLCHNNVFSILQDQFGFMWFGTQDGLARYDGRGFKIFYPNPQDTNSIASGNFGKLLQSRDGYLWLGTWGEGLDRFDPVNQTITHFTYNPQKPGGVSSHLISFLFEDKDSNIWIGYSYSGMDRYDIKTGTFTHYKNDSSNPNSLSSGRVRAICQDLKGYIWAATYGGGLNRLDLNTGEFTHLKSIPGDPATISHNYIRTIILDNNGDLWIGTRGGGLDRIDLDSGHITHYRQERNNPNSLSSDNINCLFQDSRGMIWIGMYDSGLNRFNPVSGDFMHFIHRETDNFSLSHNRIEWLTEDRSGVLWIATRGGGVNRLDLKSPRFKHYPYSKPGSIGLSIESTESVTGDKLGNIWFGSDGNGVYKLSTNKVTGKTVITPYPMDSSKYKLFDDHRVWSLLEDSFGTLWVGTYRGLKVLNPETGRYMRPPVDIPPSSPLDLETPLITDIYQDRQGIVWISTVNGLFRNSRKNGRYQGRHYFVNEKDIIGNTRDYIGTVRMDHLGHIWVGTGFGLALMTDNGQNVTFKYYRPQAGNPQSLSHKSVRVIFEDSKNRLWLGTARGLNLMDREHGTFSLITQQDGLPNNAVRAIAEDDNGNLWISTSNGLCRFNPDNKSFRNYDTHDGLLSNDFNSRAMYRRTNGEIFIGGSRGIISFYPSKVTDNPHIPPLVFTSFSVSGQHRSFFKSWFEQESIRLNYKENNFSFEFAALDYTHPEKNRYMYKLEGFDSHWIHNGNRRFAGYTNIPPGPYTFRVRGSNNDQVWNTTGTALKIEIIPPIWLTQWFRLTMLLLVLLVAYLVYTWRVRSIHRQRNKLERLVSQRTRQWEAASEKAENQRQSAEAANRAKSEFLARMSHEIRTPLNSIIGFNELLLETNLDPQQTDYVKTVHRSGELLLELIDEILDFSRIEAGQLAMEAEDFNAEAIAFDVCRIIAPRIGSRPVELICGTGPGLPPFVNGDAGKFRQVLINLVGNAVKFTETGEVEIYIDACPVKHDKIKLEVTVRDTGIGIPKDKQRGVFDVFQQADGSTKRKYGGSGLGLAICRKLAALMGGDITLKSKENSGSTFTFYAIMNGSHKKVPPFAFPLLKEKRVLLIDDNPHSRKNIANTLKKAGMVVTAHDETADIADIIMTSFKNKTGFHICLLDTRMPGTDGHQWAKDLRSFVGPVATVPLLALSTPNERQAQRFVQSGFDGYIPKPPPPDKLMEMMARILGEEKEQFSQETEPHAFTLPIPQSDIQFPCILVAEDNPINQKLIRHILERAKYTLEIVQNGREVLDTYTADPEKFALILMDIQMPEMNGMEATSAIRQWEQKGDQSPGIPIIALTAQTVKGDREKCLETGMDDFISKPINKQTLLDIIEKWLSAKKNRAPESIKSDTSGLT